MNIRTLLKRYFYFPLFIRLLITVLSAMFIFGLIIHFIEPEQFPTIFDGIWWAFVTGSTVGYGDYVPVSFYGRLIGILLLLTGGGVLTYYMVTVSTATVRRESNILKGKMAFKGANHIIIIGWNERSRQLISMIKDNELKDEVVLIDQSVKESPFSKYHYFHFIKGDPSFDETLEMANVKEAKCVIITADQSMSEKQADQQTILTTVAVRGLNKKVFIVSEVLLSRQLENAKRAGANTVVRSNEFMSTLLFHEIYRTNTIQHFDIMVEQLVSQQFNEYVIPKQFIGSTFLECSYKLGQKNEILLGIIREGKVMINPPFQTKLEGNDHLIALAPLRE
jgi:voltage-gated potassium channel